MKTALAAALLLLMLAACVVRDAGINASTMDGTVTGEARIVIPTPPQR